MLNTCAAKFDVTENLKNFYKLNKTIYIDNEEQYHQQVERCPRWCPAHSCLPPLLWRVLPFLTAQGWKNRARSYVQDFSVVPRQARACRQAVKVFFSSPTINFRLRRRPALPFLGGNKLLLTSLRALTMQDSITESKTLNYILFMVFCWCGSIFIEERGIKNKTPSLI